MAQIAFQPNAFQWGFQIMDAIPVFTDFPIPKGFREIQAGQDVFIITKISDVYTTLGVKVPLNPLSTPEIQITGPDESILQAWDTMTFLDNGLYGYQYITNTDDMPGAYAAQCRAVNGGVDGITPKVVVFKIL